MYGLLFAMLLRQSLALEILPGFTLYGLLLHGQFTAFQPLKDSIRQFLWDHMGAELGMVISWIVIAPLDYMERLSREEQVQFLKKFQ